MGSFHPLAAHASPEFIQVFRRHADASGVMTFAGFMHLALYDPQVGYYQRPRRRIGYERGTDFFTSSTSGELFGTLVAAACVNLLGGADPNDYTFVEIGAEPPSPGDSAASQGILSKVEHPFNSVRTIGMGAPMDLSGRCIVFSNELFDAQPFHRFIFRAGAWHECGVELRNGALEAIEFPLKTLAPFLPGQAGEGYVIDAPLAARTLADEITSQSWTGVFVAADYGKSWRELSEATPAGTARAYFRHTLSNDLLARPGEQDLTCHVCWDWLSDALVQHGFVTPKVESQESFFIYHAGDQIATVSAAEAAQFSRKKLSLLQLLHPSHLGQKFQVLHAQRHAVT